MPGPDGTPPEDLNELLAAARRGDREALDRLAPRVYGELRKLADGLMRRERAEHTLQATALVNEAWMRLVGQDSVGFEHRAQFFATAGTVMRRILVEHARARKAEKRGGGAAREPLDEIVANLEAGGGGDLLALEVALEDLARLHPRKARLVELRFFLGLPMREAAEILAVSLREVERDWTMTRAWLAQRLQADGLLP